MPNSFQTEAFSSAPVITTEAIQRYQYTPVTVPVSTPERIEPEMGEFRKGVMRGIDETQALLGGALGLVGDAVGSDTIRDFGYDIYKEQMEQAGEYAPAVESMYDIDSVDSFFDWVAGTAGSLLPSALGAVVSSGSGAVLGGALKTGGKKALERALAGTLKRTVRKYTARGLKGQAAAAAALKEFGGTAEGKIVKRTLQEALENKTKAAAKRATLDSLVKRGAQVGVVGFSSAVESGGNWVDDFETNPSDTNPFVDLTFGVASGLSELIGAEGLAISKFFGKNVGKKLAAEAGEEAAKKIEKGFAKILATEVAKSMAAEGGQESLQEMLSVANSYLNAHSIPAVMTLPIAKQILEAGAAGAVGGVFFGAAGGVKAGIDVRSHAKKVQMAELEKEEQEFVRKQKEKEAKQQATLSGFDQQINAIDQKYKSLQQEFVPTAPGVQSRTLGGQSNLQLAELAAMADLKRKLEKERKAAQEKMLQTSLENKAEYEAFQQNLQKRLEDINKSDGQFAVAYSAINGIQQKTKSKIQDTLNRVWREGAPSEVIAELEGLAKSLNKTVLEAAEKVAKVPSYEGYRVLDHVNDSLEKLNSINKQVAKASEWKPTDEVSTAKAVDLAHERGKKQALNELRAKNIETRSKRTQFVADRKQALRNQQEFYAAANMLSNQQTQAASSTTDVLNTFENEPIQQEFVQAQEQPDKKLAKKEEVKSSQTLPAAMNLDLNEINSWFIQTANEETSPSQKAVLQKARLVYSWIKPALQKYPILQQNSARTTPYRGIAIGRIRIIPKRLLDLEFKNQNSVAGQYDPTTGEILLFSEAIKTKEEAIRTLMHEAVAHYGLSTVFKSTKDRVNFMESVADAYAGTPIYKQIVSLYPKDITKSGIGEEIIAHQADWLVNGYPKKFPETKSSVINKLKLLIKRLLIRFGVAHPTPSDISLLLQAASKNLTRSSVKDLAEMGEYVKGQGNFKPKSVVTETGKTIKSATKKTTKATKEFGIGFIGQTKASLKRAAKKGFSYLTPDNAIDYTWASNVKTNLQDADHPLRLMLGALKELGGKINTNTNILKIKEAIPNRLVDMLRDFDRKQLSRLQSTVEAYASEMEGLSAKQVMKDIDMYLMARHAKSRNDYLRSKQTGRQSESPSGMPDDKAKRILNNQSSVKITKNLEKIGELIDYMGEHQLFLMKKFKLVPNDQIENMRQAFKHYVPLKGWADMMETFEPQYKNRVKGAKLNLMSALGREEGSLAESPLVNMVLQTMDILSVAARSDAGRSLIQLVRENPEFQDGNNFFFKELKDEAKRFHWKKDKKTGEIRWVEEDTPYAGDPRVITVIGEHGETVRLLARDQKVADAFTGNNLTVAPALIKFIGKLTRMLAKAATTLFPGFIVTNPMRDVFTAALNIQDEKRLSQSANIKDSKVVRTMLSNLNPARKIILHDLKHGKLPKGTDPEWAKAYKEFRARGAFSEQYGIEDFESLMAGMERGIKKATKSKDIFYYGSRMVGSAVDMLEIYGNSLENMTRFAAFKTLSDAWQSKNMDATEAYERAASSARNITVNFSKRGAWAPIIGPLYMFSNASIQGTTRMFKTLARHPKAMAAILSAGVVSTMMLATIGRLIGGDDEDGVAYYDKIPDWVKNTNLIFMIPGTDGAYFKIPLPYGYNVFNVAGHMVDQVARSRKSLAEGATEIVYSMFDNFSPVGSPEAGWTALVPTIFRPPMQIEANRGFFGQKIMPEVPSWVKYDYPDANRYWSTINPIVLGIANMINAVGGTTDTKKGFIDISPETIEHFLESYTAGVGKTIARAAGAFPALWNAVTKDGPDNTMAKVLTELPVIRRMWGVTNFYSTLHEFNNVKADVAGLEEGAKRAKARRTIREFREDNPNYARKVQIMNTADKKLRKLRKLKNSILRSNRSELESHRLQKIESMERKIIQSALQQINKIED